MPPAKKKTPPAPAPVHDSRTISIRGAREHNLKNVDLVIPRDKFVVFTGLSGSGKSSLAFDTIYAEGQRRYVESLSAYARQFLEMMQKPDVDQIDGLSPAISIEQKTTSKNPRSTVGTVTEIHDYMRLLWARVGIPYSPATGLPIESQTVSQMVDRVLALPEKTRLYLLAPVVRGRKGEYRKEIAEFTRRGFQRLKIDGQYYDIGETPALDKNSSTTSMWWSTASSCAPTSPRGLRTVSRRRWSCRGGLAVIEFADSPTPAPTPLPNPGRLLPTWTSKIANREHPICGGERAGVRAGDNETAGRDGQAAAALAVAAPHPGPLPAGGEREAAEIPLTAATLRVASHYAPDHILFSSKFACPVSGFTIPEIEPRLFSFNNPFGACRL